jgi:glucose-6-phosphate dehydrogenase assembly protein OpcA
MSFLYSATPAIRTAVRSSALRQSPRLFSTTLVQQKGPVEAAKDGLKKVDRAVSDAAVAGIDKGGMSLRLSCTKFNPANLVASRSERQSCLSRRHGDQQSRGQGRRSRR